MLCIPACIISKRVYPCFVAAKIKTSSANITSTCNRRQHCLTALRYHLCNINKYLSSMAETKFSFIGADAAAVNKVPIDNIGMVKVKDINDKNKENMLKLMLSPTAETKR